jgi:hypothetical protein
MLTAEEILMQIDHMVNEWFPDGIVPASKFKIQFARMGEPSLNMAVLDALEENEIGSNCGQYVLNYLESGQMVEGGYTYQVERLPNAA